MNPGQSFRSHCKFNEGRTLIVGSKVYGGTGKLDQRNFYTDAVGVDMEGGEGVDHVIDLEEPLSHYVGSILLGGGNFAHVECTSVLEHSRRPWLMAANIERLMDDGATILLMVPWVWRIHAYPSDYWRFTPQAIESLFPSIKWERQAYIVEDRLVRKVPTLIVDNNRWMARSELIMFGRKCNSIS